MKLTDGQKLQIFCAALQACVVETDGYNAAAYQARLVTEKAIKEVEERLLNDETPVGEQSTQI